MDEHLLQYLTEKDEWAQFQQKKAIGDKMADSTIHFYTGYAVAITQVLGEIKGDHLDDIAQDVNAIQARAING